MKMVAGTSMKEEAVGLSELLGGALWQGEALAGHGQSCRSLSVSSWD